MKRNYKKAENEATLMRSEDRFLALADEGILRLNEELKAALKHSEERYKSLVESVTDYVYTVKIEDGRVVETSHGPGCVSVTGYTSEEYTSDPYLWYRMVHEDDREAVADHAAKLQSVQNVLSVEHRIIHKDGTVRWVRNTRVPRRDNAGKLIAYDGLIADITERKKVERELKANKEFFQALIEKSGEIISVNDGKRNRVYVSPSVTKILGYSVDEFKAMDIKEMSHPDDFQMSEYERKWFLEHPGETREYITRICHKDGTWRWMEYSGRNLVNDPNVRGVVMNLRDITKRRQAEDQLERNLRETRIRFEVSQALAGKETEDEVLDVLIRKLGLYPQASVAIFTFELIGKTDTKTVVARRVDSFESGLPIISEGTKFSSSDHPILYEWLLAGKLYIVDDLATDKYVDDIERREFIQYGIQSIACIQLTAENELIGYLGIRARQKAFFDEEKQHLYSTIAQQGAVALRAARLRETIRASQQRLSLLVEQSPLAVIEWNLDIEIVSWNPAATRMFGYTPEEALGRSPLGFLIPQTMTQELEQSINDVFINKMEHLTVDYILTKDGRSIICEWFSSLLVGSDGKTVGIVSLVQDITKRKQAEEEVRRLNEELEQRVVDRTAQLNAANKELEAFSYSVSHDLRTPLRAIDGYTRILHEDYADKFDDEGKRVCEVISSETRRMGQLIDDLLSFSRLSRSEIKISSINMNMLVKSVFEELSSVTHIEKYNISIDDLPAVKGDQSLLRQVWTNLISNSIKFTSKKEHPVIEIKGSTNKKIILYSIKDNGAGFDMQYADKLFGVFQRLHNSKDFEGTGVGLAIVQRIIHRHGGRIWAKAEPDKGASFFFTLPNG